MTHIHPTRPRALRLILALLLLAATPAAAQDFYVITNGDNILAHTNATTIGNVAGNNFNINTCLWTVDGNKIATVTPEGTTGYQIYWTNNNQPLTLSTPGNGDDYSNVSDGQNPYNTYRGTNYYIVYNNNGWRISSTNSNNGTMHRVTVTTNTTTGSTPTSESYTATIGGNTAIYTTGAHNFSRTITHSATYTTTTTKTFSVSIYGTNRSGNTTENGTTTTTETYTGALTDVAWSVSPTTYGNINASTGELTITSLPTDVANLTVTFNAQAAGQPVSGTMTVMLAKDAATAEGVAGQATGVTTTTVTLNDYEDHSWSYYNNATLPQQLRSLNPANVKITYYGNGTGTVSTTDGATPAANSWTANASNVQVSYNETQHTFIYYKTLERNDGSTSANPTGRCKYKTIPNPFSKRPVYNTGDARWRGFYAWRVKSLSGGTIHSAATGGTSYGVGSTINAETEIYFAPTSEYGMTVELEALWARAYVKTGNANTLDAINTLSTNLNGGSYERNFFVITGGNTDAAINRTQNPVTISCRYPDGSTGGSLTSTIQNNFTANAITKFEYVNFNATTFTANGIGLVIGRGCTGTINEVKGISAQINNTEYSLRIESGEFTTVSAVSNSANTANMGTGHALLTLGCDYDRALENNDNLSITALQGGNREYFNNNNSRIGIESIGYTIKSGSFNKDIPIDRAAEEECIYLAVYNGRDMGTRSLLIEGGNINSLAGGQEHYTSGASNSDKVNIRIKGGIIRGSIYGAAAWYNADGNRSIVITGGKVKGWIAGGCNGRTTDGGSTTGSSYIYIGGNCEIGNPDNPSSDIHIGATIAGQGTNGADGGNIFGAGCGINPASGNIATLSVGKMYASTIAIADESRISKNVYGGGNFGFIGTDGGDKSSSIFILGGTTYGSIFGGSNNQQGQKVNIQMTGGTVIGGVYGGSNASGTVAGPVNVTISGGTVGESGINAETSEVGHVFGSGYGAGTSVTGNVVVTIGDATGSHKDSPLIHGNVYGGGHAAPYTSTGKTFQVIGQNGLVKGSIFGGGKGSSAVVTGPTDVHLKGHIVVESNVFGGGHAATVTGDTHVTMED